MFLLIDNYDSFTYNLVHLLGRQGIDVRVYANDRISPADIRDLNPRAIVLSSGSGLPEGAGVSVPCITEFGARIPVFGVGLGQLCIAAAFGARLVPAREPVHGKTAAVHHGEEGLFVGLPRPMAATRYDSWVVGEPVPSPLEVTARTSEGEIMGLQHREWPVASVQFDPGSIFTEGGDRLMENVVRWVNGWWSRQGGHGPIVQGKELAR